MMNIYFLLFFYLGCFSTSTMHASDTKVAECSIENPHTKITQKYASRIFYKISKDGIFHGYLLGSVHSSSKKVQIFLRQHLLPWLKSCKTIFGETNSIFKQKNHEESLEKKENVQEKNLQADKSKKYAGTEDIINDLIKKHSLSFTSQGFNQDMFNFAVVFPSAVKFLHNYHATLQYPYIILLLKLLSFGYFGQYYTPKFIFKIFFSVIRDLTLSSKTGQETQGDPRDMLVFDIISKMMSHYKKQKVKVNWNEPDGCFVYERNISWIETIKQQPLDTPTLYVVGAAHLPGPYGLIDLLEQNGYQCQAISLTGSPENPIVLDDFYKPITAQQRALYDATRMTYMKLVLEDGKEACFIAMYHILYNYYKKYHEKGNEEIKIFSEPWVYGPFILSAFSYFVEFVTTQKITETESLTDAHKKIV